MEYKFNKADAISSLRPSATFGWNEETDVISQWSEEEYGSCLLYTSPSPRD